MSPRSWTGDYYCRKDVGRPCTARTVGGCNSVRSLAKVIHRYQGWAMPPSARELVQSRGRDGACCLGSCGLQGFQTTAVSKMPGGLGCAGYVAHPGPPRQACARMTSGCQALADCQKLTRASYLKPQGPRERAQAYATTGVRRSSAE